MYSVLIRKFKFSQGSFDQHKNYSFASIEVCASLAIQNRTDLYKKMTYNLQLVGDDVEYVRTKFRH